MKTCHVRSNWHDGTLRYATIRLTRLAGPNRWLKLLIIIMMVIISRIESRATADWQAAADIKEAKILWKTDDDEEDDEHQKLFLVPCFARAARVARADSPTKATKSSNNRRSKSTVYALHAFSAYTMADSVVQTGLGPQADHRRSLICGTERKTGKPIGNDRKYTIYIYIKIGIEGDSGRTRKRGTRAGE